MTKLEELNELLDALETRAGHAATVRKYMTGRQARAFLSKESKESLKGGLDRLGVNIPGLVVGSHADRMKVIGIETEGEDEPDADAWEAWKLAGLVERSEHLITDRLAYGCAYLTVWADDNSPRVPLVTVDTPRTMAVTVDPLTGRVTKAVRKWDYQGKTHALVYTAYDVTYWTANTTGAIAGSGWQQQFTKPHGLRACPVIAFTRRLSADDWHGVSIIDDVSDLADLLNKLMADMAVTSEYFARPRRWATGLEIVEDEDGNPIDPFGDDRFLQSEAPETKFGQLPPAGLEAYAGPIATVTQMIGALTGIPPHYLGLHGDQPANADSVKAAETQLTSRTYSEMRGMDDPFSWALELMRRVRTGVVDGGPRQSVIWDTPEIRTPGQAADAASKLATIGVPLETLLTDVLKWTPERAAAAVNSKRGEAVLGALATRGSML